MALIFTPGNAVLSGAFPSGPGPAGIGTPNGVTWDGLQLLIADNSGDELWTLARNANGTYTPGNAVNHGAFPSGLSFPSGVTWDGQQLVIVDEDSGDELWTLARNADGTYTPGNAVNRGTIVGPGSPRGITWDGQQLVIVDEAGNDELWTLGRNADGTYTPGNAVHSGTFPSGLGLPSGVTWDGLQLLIADNDGDELWTLARNADGTYTPSNAVNRGAFPSDLISPAGVTWDGQQLIVVELHPNGELWTLQTDSSAPTISAISATPALIDHNATSALEVTAADIDPGDTLSYRWTSDVGGTFSAPTAASTNWTAPSSITSAYVATLSVVVTDSTLLTASDSVQVTVREMGAPPLALPAVGDMAGATGDVVDVVIAATASGGRSPYTYAFTGLPPETGAVGRRIRGRLVTPGSFTVTMTVTDANGDTASRDFDWVVTGNAIVPPSGINVRIDWGDASYSRPEADVTARLISGIACRRGRNNSSATLGRTVAGRLTFDLDNSDGLYDLENTASTLHGQIRPGIQAQLRDGGDVLWTGVLDSIPTAYQDNGRHRARVTALGVYSTLVDADAQVGSLSSTTTSQAFCELLEEVDTCGTIYGSGFYTMPRWWELGRVRVAIQDIEDTEGGFAFEDRLGTLGFQSAGWRASRTLAATFTGLATTLAGEIAIVGRPKREIAIKDVISQVVGFVREFEQETAQTVLKRSQAVAVPLGGSVLLVSDFEEDGAVLSIDTPVAGTDYVARRNADGTGAVDTHRLTLTATINRFNEMQVEVLYPTQGGNEPNEVFLTEADIKGTVLRRLAPDKVVRSSAEAVTRFKRKTLELRETWIATRQAMATRADALLDQLGDSEKRVEFAWIVESYADFLALDISDRIQLKLPAYTDDAFIENMALTIPISGLLPVCTIQATVAAGMATPPPPPPGDSVTVPLTGFSSFSNFIRWADNQSIGSVFDANDQEQVITFVELNNASPAGEVTISIVGTNNRFTPEFEATGRIIFEASDGEMLEVMIADADMSETYTWVPTNSAEVVAFVLHVNGLTDQDATLTLSD